MNIALYIVRFYVITRIIVLFFMIAIFKLFYNTIAACQRPVGLLLSNKCMYYRQACPQGSMPDLRLPSGPKMGFWRGGLLVQKYGNTAPTPSTFGILPTNLPISGDSFAQF